MATYTIVEDDAISAMQNKSLPPIGLVVTSPPYNLGKDYGQIADNLEWEAYLGWTKRWTAAAWECLEVGGKLCLNVPLDINVKWENGEGKPKSQKLPFYHDVMRMALGSSDWVYNTTILWLEGNISRRTAWGSWISASDPWINTAAEMIIVLSKGQRKRTGVTSTITPEDFKAWTLGMWTFPGESAKRIGHPSPFPIELPRRLIQLFSYEEDLVLDPFAGSGTTLVASLAAKRSTIGIESNPQFVKLATERIEKSLSSSLATTSPV